MRNQPSNVYNISGLNDGEFSKSANLPNTSSFFFNFYKINKISHIIKKKKISNEAQEFL